MFFIIMKCSETNVGTIIQNKYKRIIGNDNQSKKDQSVNTFAKDSIQFWMLCRPGAASGGSPTTETALPDLISNV